MTTSTSTPTPGFRTIATKAPDIKKGDVVLYTHDHPVTWTVTETSFRRDDHGDVYQFRFEGSDNPPPMAFRKNNTMLVLHALPKVGDGATMRAGSDAYPYEVLSVSASGHTITIRRMDAKVVSGSFQTNNAVIEYSSNEDHVVHTARWSRARNRYVAQGLPVSVGHARYYQDPSY